MRPLFPDHAGMSTSAFAQRNPPRFLTRPQVMIEMKNKETPFCESAQRTESYVAVWESGSNTVIRRLGRFNTI